MTPVTPLESAFTRTAGCHPQFSSLSSSVRRCTARTSSLSFLSFQPVTNCKSHNPFGLTFIQNARGVYPTSLQLFVANLHLYFQSLPRCSSRNLFLFMLLHRCRSCFALRSTLCLRLATSFPLFSRAWAPPLSGRPEGYSKHRYFKSFKMRSYTIWRCKSFRMRSCEKDGGGVAIPESPVTIFACVMISSRCVKASAS